MKTDNNIKLSPEEREWTLDRLQFVNDLNFNMLKVIEEVFETGELLTKRLTKAPIYQPTDEDLIEEIGDLEMRLEVFKAHLGLTDAVKARIEGKLALLNEYLKEEAIGTTVVITKQFI